MVKYSPEEKIEIVKNYLEGNVKGKTYAKTIGVHISMLHQWVKHYRTLGEAAFNKRYTSYSTQYKLDVLNFMNEQGTSVRETAAMFDIPSPETLRKWKIAYETEGIDALKPKKKRRQSMSKNYDEHDGRYGYRRIRKSTSFSCIQIKVGTIK